MQCIARIIISSDYNHLNITLNIAEKFVNFYGAVSDLFFKHK